MHTQYLALRKLLGMFGVPDLPPDMEYELTPGGLYIVPAPQTMERVPVLAIPFNPPGSPETYTTRIAAFVKLAKRLIPEAAK